MKWLRIKYSSLLFLVSIVLSLSISATASAEMYEYVGKWGSYGTGAGQFDRPLGVSVDHNNSDIIVTDINGRIQKFNHNGNYINQQSIGPISVNYYINYGVAVDSNGNIYILVAANYIYKYDSSLNYQGRWGCRCLGNDQDIYNHQSIAIGPNDDIYIIDSERRPGFYYAIKRIRINGHNMTQTVVKGGISGGTPGGIAVDRNDDIYFATNDGNVIVKYDTNGQELAQYNYSKYCSDEKDGFIGAITLDNKSNIYAVQECWHNPGGNENFIIKLDSNGRQIAKWGKHGTDNGQFKVARGIALNDKKDVYIPDMLNNRIQKFALKNERTSTPTKPECQPQIDNCFVQEFKKPDIIRTLPEKVGVCRYSQQLGRMLCMDELGGILPKSETGPRPGPRFDEPRLDRKDVIRSDNSQTYSELFNNGLYSTHSESSVEIFR